MDRILGTVKWFNPQLGYGFVDGPFCEGSYSDGTNDYLYKGTGYYLHYTQIELPESIDGKRVYRTLQNGQAVTFEPFLTPRGNHMAAGHVKPIGINIIDNGGNNGDYNN